MASMNHTYDADSTRNICTHIHLRLRESAQVPQKRMLNRMNKTTQPGEQTALITFWREGRPEAGSRLPENRASLTWKPDASARDSAVRMPSLRASLADASGYLRSEERRVGKEGRSR